MADCTKLHRHLNQIAMNIGSRPGMGNIDKVLDKMQTLIPGLERQGLIEAIVSASTGQKQQTEATAQQLNDLKKMARKEVRLQRVVADLQNYLDNGIVPPTKKRAVNQAVESPAIELLEETRDILKSKIRSSDAVMEAKLNRQIKELDKRIETGDIFPKTKPRPVAGTKALRQMEHNVKMRKRQIREQLRLLRPTSLWQRTVGWPLDFARSMKTSFDISATLRQGGFFVMSHPLKGAKNFPMMLKALASERYAQQVMDEIENRDTAWQHQHFKLEITSLDQLAEARHRSEDYRASTRIGLWLAKHFPGLRMSERAYTVFLNKIRADHFDFLMNKLTLKGEPTEAEGFAIAKFINESTGRGGLGKLEGAADGLNQILFAPRYVASRFQMLGGHSMWRGTNRTRKMIAMEYARYLAGIGAVYALASLAGGDLEDDLRSADFGKIRVGKVRLDPLSGMSQAIVLLARMSGKSTSSVSGLTHPLRGDEVRYGKTTMMDTIANFARYKASPLGGLILNSLTGETPMGDPYTPTVAVKDMFMPMALSEVYGAMREQGVPAGSATALLTLSGWGLNIYDNQEAYVTESKIDDKGKLVAHSRVKGLPWADKFALYDDLEPRLQRDVYPEMLDWWAGTSADTKEKYSNEWAEMNKGNPIRHASTRQLREIMLDSIYTKKYTHPDTKRVSYPGSPKTGKRELVNQIRAELRRRK